IDGGPFSSRCRTSRPRPSDRKPEAKTTSGTSCGRGRRIAEEPQAKGKTLPTLGWTGHPPRPWLCQGGAHGRAGLGLGPERPLTPWTPPGFVSVPEGAETNRSAQGTAGLGLGKERFRTPRTPPRPAAPRSDPLARKNLCTVRRSVVGEVG